MSLWLRSAAATLAVAMGPASAGAIDLVPHRAVYELGLADGGATLTESTGAVTGRMVFEFTGAACEGYTVNFRFVMEMADVDGQRVITDLRTSSFEEGNGESFQFLSQTYTNQVLTDEVKGSASREDGTVKVRLVTPAAAEVVFNPAPIFPTDHLRQILAAAEAGKTLIEQDVFDGSESGDKVFRTTAVVGLPRSDAVLGSEKLIGTARRWPVSVAYFDNDAQGDLMPAYSISFDLWANGISSDLTMDYGEFALTGELTKVQMLPESSCS